MTGEIRSTSGTGSCVAGRKYLAQIQFMKVWVARNGGELEGLLDAVAGVVARRSDTDRIADARARAAYREWVKVGSVPGAARELGIETEIVRERIVAAARDLFQQAMLRGRAINWKALVKRGGDLAAYLELRQPGAEADPLVERLDQARAGVRVAFGCGALSEATHTLGSFLQGRLGRPEDCDGECRALRLSPGTLRDLIGGAQSPDRALLARLARGLRVPAARLRRRC